MAANIPGSKDYAPPKSPETQMETLRRVIPEMAAGSIKGNTVDLLGLPVDIVNNVLDVVGLKSAKPIGGADHLRELFGQKSTSEDTPAEVGGSFVSPAGAAKAMVVGAARLMKSERYAPEVISKIQQTARDAADMEMAGVKAGVFNTTGTYVGREGKVRGVISDAQAAFRPGAVGVRLGTHDDPRTVIDSVRVNTLEDLLRHDELYALYPELKDYKIRSNPQMRTGEALHEGGPRVMTFGPAQSAEKLRTMVLHEVQHAVQKVEDFVAGATPQEFLRIERPSPDKIQRLQQLAGSDDPTTKKVAQRFLDRLNADYKRAYESYRIVPGEVEARFTEQNANLTKAELNSKIYDLIATDTPTSMWAR